MGHLHRVLIVEQVIQGPIERFLVVCPFRHCFSSGQCLIIGDTIDWQLVVLVCRPQATSDRVHHALIELPPEHLVGLFIYALLFGVESIGDGPKTGLGFPCLR